MKAIVVTEPFRSGFDNATSLRCHYIVNDGVWRHQGGTGLAHTLKDLTDKYIFFLNVLVNVLFYIEISSAIALKISKTPRVNFSCPPPYPFLGRLHLPASLATPPCGRQHTQRHGRVYGSKRELYCGQESSTQSDRNGSSSWVLPLLDNGPSSMQCFVTVTRLARRASRCSEYVQSMLQML